MPSRRPPRAADLPALQAFARGYLHEDVASPENAIEAFAHDASPAERRQLLTDLQRVAAAMDAGRLAHFFIHDLRASWAPRTIGDLQALIARLEQA
jgi:hypothetical protein